MLIEHINGLILNRYDKLQERNWRTDETYKFIFSPVGKSCYETKRENLTLRQNHFVIINPLYEHRQLHVDQEKFLVELSTDLMKKTFYELGFRHSFDVSFIFLPFRHPQLTRWVQMTRDYLSIADSEEAGLFVDYGLTQLCLLLIKYGIGSHTSHWPDNPLERTSEPIHKVVDALKEDFRHPWTLDEMAQIAGLSKYQLAHQFTETLGLSPFGWLQTYRLLISQSLLRNRKDSILTIALACGFSSVGLYHHLFKKLYGTTPAAFRRNFD
ncbi:helix-turn-helix domain-containing protein [Camelliibacillus cellulosilyticus]|uniref:Helix-turn-helix domain-containing protein n=1 Tax=Camelliibacillus cellulosilyticus TaxID=2174486 RepID=A0ABV9GIR4_9BACL